MLIIRGVFSDNFKGTWGAIDDTVVYMDIIDVTDTHSFYAVPILLNGEEYSLRVSYTHRTERYRILGARQGIDDNGMADKNLRRLRPGDVIEPLLYFMLGDDEYDELYEVPVAKITVNSRTRFHEGDMGDGIFIVMFEMVDIRNNSFYSNLAFILVKEGEIYTMEFEDD